jgi:hypothetical protein
MPTKFTVKLNKALALVSTVDEAEVIDWVPALKAAAQEIEVLNTMSGTATFPRPFTCNENAAQWEDEHVITVPETTERRLVNVIADVVDAENNTVIPGYEVWDDVVIPAHEVTVPAGYVGKIDGFLGALNTPPTEDGMCTVVIENYDWLDLGFLPEGVTPQTFTFILGVPPHAGTVI